MNNCWINIYDRLPTDMTPVIVTERFYGDDFPVPYLLDVIYCARYNAEKGYWEQLYEDGDRGKTWYGKTIRGGWGKADGIVTHWMPRLEPAEINSDQSPAQALQKKSDDAVGIVTKALDKLRTANDGIVLECESNEARIASLHETNTTLNDLRERNSKIISNFEALLN